MSAIQHKIAPKKKDLGEMMVRRALPVINQRSIGPWVFFDHFGPVDFKPGNGMNVRPHPHIGLATVSYLFEGEIYHRDSLGNALPIHPGAINLMVAGNGITHSERTRDALKATGYRMHGLQLWHALPEADEQIDPAFHHYPADDIPEVELDSGAVARVLMGTAFGVTSPVKTFSENLYFELRMPAGTSVTIPDTEERGVYVVKGGVEIDGEQSELFTMSVLKRGECTVTAVEDSRLAVIGGASLGPRIIKWNFVATSEELIQNGARRWNNGEFPQVPGDTQEFIPLPKELIF